MSSPYAFEPIEDYLRVEWPLLEPSVPLVFENEPWPLPDNPAAFVHVEIYSDMIYMASIGSGDVPDNRWREEGTIMMHVMTRSGEGTRLARQYAWKLINLFRINEIAIPTGSLRFSVSEAGMSIGSSERSEVDGNYFRITARVDFERDD